MVPRSCVAPVLSYVSLTKTPVLCYCARKLPKNFVYENWLEYGRIDVGLQLFVKNEKSRAAMSKKILLLILKLFRIHLGSNLVKFRILGYDFVKTPT